ncbi:sugar ABC transporter ATP-binding protein, partial [Mesorhizobium sp. M7D.F.Ca.US.004.03.1.1]
AAGSGVLLVSSDLSELLQLCDRISIVVDGRITRTISRAEFGSAEDLHHLIQLSQPSEEHAA